MKFDIEPELKGTIIGKLRFLMRELGLGDKSAGQFYDALDRAGLQIDHKMRMGPGWVAPRPPQDAR